MYQIKRWDNEEVIHEYGGTAKECLEDGVKKGIDFSFARLYYTRLDNANLENARLENANLDNANLDNARLENARLENARLHNAKHIIFTKFPSIQKFNFYFIVNKNKLITELMKWDMVTHPKPELFKVWAEGGDCPYNGGYEYSFRFNYSRQLFEEGPPTMTWPELCIAICEDNGWKIKGFLE